MHEDYPADTTSNVEATNNPTWGGGSGGFWSGLTNLAGAAGGIVSAVRGNGSAQNNQAAAASQAAQAAGISANRNLYLVIGGVVLALVAVIFIARRK